MDKIDTMSLDKIGIIMTKSGNIVYLWVAS